MIKKPKKIKKIKEIKENKKKDNIMNIDLSIPNIPLKNTENTENTENKEVSSSSEDNKIPNEIKSILDKMIACNILEERKRRIFPEENGKLGENDIKILMSLIEEYFKCFIILGYNIYDNSEIIMKCKNEKENDALAQLFKKAFLSSSGLI